MTPGLTADELIALVHLYYPTGLYSDEPGYKESEPFQRLLQVRESVARERAPLWRAFFRSVQAELPGSFVWDLTYLRHDNCHRIRAYVPGTPKDDARAVMACLSILAPVYIIYTSNERRVDGRNLPTERFYEPRPETEHLQNVIESNIQTMFGFTRLPNDLLFTPVPDIQCGNVRLGAATLADCLFTDDRW